MSSPDPAVPAAAAAPVPLPARAEETTAAVVARPRAARPRLGFLGVGWIGLDRLKAVATGGFAEVAAIADLAPENLARAAEAAPAAARGAGLDELLALDLDGLVIATPSALHAPQSIAAFERGLAVFCQKPLGRTAAETAAVVDAARRADRLLEVDLSYRRVAGVAALRERIRRDVLGTVFAADLVFHNAYGPDKPWFRDPALSGGGCVMDLGVHLVDLVLWVLDFPRVEHVTSRLHAGGRPLAPGAGRVEDHAVARLDLAGGITVTLACSWNLHAGQDAIISARFHGTRGGAVLRNVGGSFHDFVTERLEGTARSTLTAPPDAWGGRAIEDWARRLGRGERFDETAERLVDVARVLDRIYQR